MTAVKRQSDHRRQPAVIGAIAIALLTIIAYFPAIAAGGFIWDDDDYLTRNPYLRDAAGLVQLWVPGNTHQYYPAVFTTFWLEHQLWGLDPTGYHLVNVLLHLAVALLLWHIMTRLGVPGAWFIAAVFALHPAHVESVAWITERKNVLSGVFYFLAATFYLRFDPMTPGGAERSGGREAHAAAGTAAPAVEGQKRTADRARSTSWILSLLFFTAALLSKSVTCSLPAALILVMVLRGTDLTWRRVLPLLPMFLLGLIAAAHTAYLERASVGAFGEAFDYSFLERCLIAARALLFYPWKLLIPYPLMFVYPRWDIDAGDVLSYWPLLIVAGVAVACIIAFLRGRRGPAIALAFYAGTIFPALGFFNVYPHRFSFVADHFQYLASIGIIALVVGSVATWLPQRLPRIGLGTVVLTALAVLTLAQSSLYRDAETIWRDTIEKNDEAWLAHNNLASLLLRRVEAITAAQPEAPVEELIEEARHHAARTIELKPEHDRAHVNLAEALRLLGRYEEALEHQKRAIELTQDRLSRRARGQPPSWVAIDYFQLGRLYELLGRDEHALEAYRTSIGIRDEYPLVLHEFGRLLVERGLLEEAAAIYAQLLRLQPDDFVALGTLATIHERLGNEATAESLYRAAFTNAPSTLQRVQFRIRLIRLLATASDPQVRKPREAIELAEELARMSNRRDPAALDVLASVYAQAGRMEDAISTAEEAVQRAEEAGWSDMIEQIRRRLEEYRQRRQDPAG